MIISYFKTQKNGTLNYKGVKKIFRTLRHKKVRKIDFSTLLPEISSFFPRVVMKNILRNLAQGVPVSVPSTPLCNILLRRIWQRVQKHYARVALSISYNFCALINTSKIENFRFACFNINLNLLCFQNVILIGKILNTDKMQKKM